jgi:hypothetical protein
MQSATINAELQNSFGLYVGEGVVALDTNQDTVTDWQVYGYRYLSFTHQCHHLIFYRHVTYYRRVVYFAHHLLEKVAYIFLLFIATFLLL